MKFGLRYLAVAASMWCAPACADMTARYVMSDGQTAMTIEIASNGNLRTTFDDPTSYFLTSAGRDYLVKVGATGPIVMRREDIATVMIEQVDTKRRPILKTGKDEHPVQGGEVRIRGRQGVAYDLSRSGRDGTDEEPLLVISGDPALAPLATAVRRQFTSSFGTMDSLFGDASPWKGMASTLDKGTPLSFLGMQLDAVDRDPIATSRFVLPAPPLSLDAVRSDLNEMP